MKIRGLLIGAICSVVAGMGMLAHAESALREATIQPGNGSLEWQSQGTGSWQAVSQSLPIKQGDRLRTAAGSSAMLRLDDGSQLQLAGNTEVSVQTLKRDSAGNLQSIFGLLSGSASMTVNPMKEGSLFQIETVAATARVPAIAKVTQARLTIGSIDVEVSSGTVYIIRTGDNPLKIVLEQGQHALVESTPSGDTLTITNLGGTFDAEGSGGRRVTLGLRDSVTFQTGAATFIPSQPDLGNAPAPDPDPLERTNSDQPASTFSTPSGG